ncbi:YCF48-related protein [Mucilaginibacter terrae]|uniref:YCF48-related protein n=1 Tax=Mucilaginibacter terrae TaxID=1955052 RepID=UPI0036391FAE
MKYTFVFICLLLSVELVTGQTITLVEQGKPTSIRGLSVVDDHVAWVSGSKGHVALSTNGGQSWTWQQVKGYEQSDFRDIEAFSDKEAIIMSSGTPALILKTVNGGANWKEVYREDDKAYFLDAMDFTANGKYGYVLGDPIEGKFLMLESSDSGNSWQKLKHMPAALPGEAAFAASGTCLRVSKNKVINIVTGGSTARLLTFYNIDTTWQTLKIPIAQGKPSQGAFSISNDFAVIVGGDYANAKRLDSVSVNFNKTQVITSKGKTPGPAGYQSCVEWLNKKQYLATGTPGSNLTNDGGKTWKQIDTTSYNVCQKAKKGSLVILAGDKGKIAVFKL